MKPAVWDAGQRLWERGYGTAPAPSQPEMKGAAAAVLTPDRTDSPEPEVSGTRWSPRTSSADELGHVTDVGNFAPEASRARPISVT